MWRHQIFTIYLRWLFYCSFSLLNRYRLLQPVKSIKLIQSTRVSNVEHLCKRQVSYHVVRFLLFLLLYLYSLSDIYICIKSKRNKKSFKIREFRENELFIVSLSLSNPVCLLYTSSPTCPILISLEAVTVWIVFGLQLDLKFCFSGFYRFLLSTCITKETSFYTDTPYVRLNFNIDRWTWV